MAVTKKSMINSKSSKKPTAKKASPKSTKPVASAEKLTTAFIVR